MKKGKRYQVKEKKRKKYKIKNKKLLFLIGTIIIGIMISWKSTDKEIEVQAEEEENIQIATLEIQETNTNAVSAEETEEIKIEEKQANVDEEIKNLITNIREEENLTEKNFSFFYDNNEENTFYFYNQNTYFTAASTVKIPVAMIYYDQIQAGEIQEEDKILYQKSSYEVGNGATAATYKIGQYVPIQFLLKQAIINSDNTAVNILIDGMEDTSYRYEIAKYSQQELPESFYQSNITSASFCYDILTRIEENVENYQELLEYMKQSSGGGYLKKYITEYEVAHKYGNYNGYVHDYGIVYGPSTYKIGIFTKNVNQAEELIATINEQIIHLLEK